MGFWGTSLYTNDLALDVRDFYLDRLKEQNSDEQAESLTILEYQSAIIDQEEGALFWYALADVQWGVGRLSSNVKNEAIERIQKGGGSSLFCEVKNGREKWEKTLKKLETKITSPMPSRRRLRAQKKFITNPWNVGDYYAYQLCSSFANRNGFARKYIVLHKLADVETDVETVCSIIEVMEGAFEKIPSMEEVKKYRSLPLINIEFQEQRNAVPKQEYEDELKRNQRACMIIEKPSDFKEQEYVFIGNDSDESRKRSFKHNNFFYLYWNRKNLDEWICELLLEWQGVPR